ncbi:hypothetical protein [Fibrella aquatica]|uniref:hypothetical protein n=1 Tax=Fibrella aquatica TaxID=3242487 RepID=UPI003522ACF7
MVTLELNSAEKWRKAWSYFTPEQIAGFVESGDLSMDFEATTNQSVVYRTYSGTASLRVIYRAFGEVVSPPEAGWQTFNLAPATAYMVTGLILQQEPAVLAALIAMNGGSMPDIKEPIVPVIIVPDPVVEEPAEEEPTEPEAAGEETE